MKTRNFYSVTLIVAAVVLATGLSFADKEVQVNANAMNNADVLFELLEQPQAAQPVVQPAPAQPEADAPELDPKSLETLKDFFDRAEVAEPITLANLKIFPILRTREQDVDKKSFIPTDKAIKKKVIKVKEHQGGTVQKLKIGKKKSDKPVFMMGGEILSGAKQDRILGQDVLLPNKKGSHVVSVYCVEAGRWVMKTKSFSSKGVMGTAKLRKTVAKKGGQSKVWNEVSKKSGNMKVHSPTSAMMANYDAPKNKAKIKKIWKKLNKSIEELIEDEDLIGFVATVKGEIISLDAFRNEELFIALWPKLSKSVALDAIDPSFKDGEVTDEDVELFIESLDKAKLKALKNPGIGQEVSIESSWASGTAHLSKKGVNHVNLFPEYSNLKMRVFTDKVKGYKGGKGGKGYKGGKGDQPQAGSDNNADKAGKQKKSKAKGSADSGGNSKATKTKYYPPTTKSKKKSYKK